MSQYFVRFVYTWVGADVGAGSWRATEMDVARASELPDSAQQLLARRWTALVRSCAIKLGRVESNLPAYTSSSSVSKQLAALGTDRAATLLEYAEKVEAAGAPGALSAEESEFLQRSIAEALASPLVINQNGARAVRELSLPSLFATRGADSLSLSAQGLASIKYLSGSGKSYTPKFAVQRQKQATGAAAAAAVPTTAKA